MCERGLMACALELPLGLGMQESTIRITISERHCTFGWRKRYRGKNPFTCILSSAKQSKFMGISLKWQGRKTLRNFY